MPDFIDFVKAVRRLLFQCPAEKDETKLKEKIAKAIDYWQKEGFLDKSIE